MQRKGSFQFQSTQLIFFMSNAVVLVISYTNKINLNVMRMCGYSCCAWLYTSWTKLMPQQECIPVGCVLSTAVAISTPGGCLLPGGGVHAWGVCSWGVSVPRGAWFEGVSAPRGGVCSWGVFSGGVPGLEGYPSMHWGRPPCEQNDRQV